MGVEVSRLKLASVRKLLPGTMDVYIDIDLDINVDIDVDIDVNLDVNKLIT